MTPSATLPFVLVAIGDQTCALPTSSVHEVFRMVAIRPMPAAPHWVAGMINLRGRPVVVVDLRLRLGTGSPERGLATPILVANTSSGKLVALIVDAVHALRDVAADAVFPAGEAGLIQAVARIGADLVNVLDVDAVAAGADQLVAAGAS